MLLGPLLGVISVLGHHLLRIPGLGGLPQFFEAVAGSRTFLLQAGGALLLLVPRAEFLVAHSSCLPSPVVLAARSAGNPIERTRLMDEPGSFLSNGDQNLSNACSASWVITATPVSMQPSSTW